MAKVIHVEIEQGTSTDPKANGLLLRQKERIEKEHLGGGGGRGQSVYVAGTTRSSSFARIAP